MPGPDWPAARKAAAWYIREGRRLLRAHSRLSGQISRPDNKDVFEMGRRLISIGRRIAMGYELEVWTDAIYLRHLVATRPGRKPAAVESLLLTEDEAAKMIGFSRRTLQGWRSNGVTGLPFIRVSRGCVRYRRSDIEAWIEDQVRRSTADDAARGTVLREKTAAG